jgi:tRNA(adenine34) deaminase
MLLDEYFMREALEEAREAFDKDEVPVGAVLVVDEKIIARAHNLVETLKDSSAHAEMLCLREGARVLGNWRLLNATLYSTLEPCCMCAGAIFLSRIKTVVWGASDIRQGADGSWISVMNGSHPVHNPIVRRHVLVNESAQLLRDFFKQKRIKDDNEKFI